MLLSVARPSLIVSPIRSKVARKILSGSVVTIKRAGLSCIFLRCGRLGARTVTSMFVGAVAGGVDGIYGGSISVLSRLRLGVAGMFMSDPASTPLDLPASVRGGVGVGGTISG